MLAFISTNVASQFVEYCIIKKFLLLLQYRPTYRILDFFCCSFLPLQWSAIIIIIIIIIMFSVNGFSNFDSLLLKGILGYPFKTHTNRKPI